MTALPASASVTLPWPAKALSPNARVHHMVLASERRQAKATAHWACKLWRLHKPEGRLALTIVFSPPDNRRRDLDNMLASCKPHLDGIAEYLGVDDSTWSLNLQRGEPIRNGQVRVIVEVAE